MMEDKSVAHPDSDARALGFSHRLGPGERTRNVSNQEKASKRLMIRS